MIWVPLVIEVFTLVWSLENSGVAKDGEDGVFLLNVSFIPPLPFDYVEKELPLLSRDIGPGIGPYRGNAGP